MTTDLAATPDAPPHGADAREVRPFVSVVIPYYRCLPYITEALDSALAQTYSRYEIILANDGSPDTEELRALIAPYGNRIRYLELPHKGVSATRNAAVRAARGELIALLDADDRWEPNYLEVQVAEMLKDDRIDVVYPDALIIGDAPEAGKKFTDLNPSTGPATFARLVRQECNVMISALVRRDTMVAVGLFDESIGMSEDFDLWLRIAARGGRIVSHGRVLAHYRRRRGSATSDALRVARGVLHVFDKSAHTLPLTPADVQAIEESRRRVAAMARFQEARLAFFGQDTRAAIEGFRECNRYYRSAKLAVVILALRLFPRGLLALYDLRDRLVYRVRTRS